MQQPMLAAPIAECFARGLSEKFAFGSGYSQHFGIVYVDEAMQRRISKTPVQWYADMIAARRASQVPARLAEPVEAAEEWACGFFWRILAAPMRASR